MAISRGGVAAEQRGRALEYACRELIVMMSNIPGYCVRPGAKDSGKDGSNIGVRGAREDRLAQETIASFSSGSEAWVGTKGAETQEVKSIIVKSSK